MPIVRMVRFGWSKVAQCIILMPLLINADMHFWFIFSVALQDILQAFRDPENVRRLDEARENAGNDMLRAMQTVFPVASQIEMEVIEKYGFPPDGDGEAVTNIFLCSFNFN